MFSKYINFLPLTTSRRGQSKYNSALNNLGKKGWELIQFDPGTDTGIEIII
jgi:hypothetical protein